MKHFHAILMCSVSVGLMLSACENKETPKTAVSDAAIQTEPEATAPRRLPPPPGEPGPVLIRIQDLFPTQIFAFSAGLEHIALAMQSDARDPSLCPDTGFNYCFHGIGVIAPRRNPNQPKSIKLYESDTQSGSRIDDVAAVQNKFIFALNEGQYVGDTPIVKLVVVNENAESEREITLSAPDIHISQVTLNTLDDERILVCKAIEPIQGAPGIICEKLDPVSGKSSPAATIQTHLPVRSFNVSVSGEHILAVWIEANYANAAFLNEPLNKLELGLATVQKPHIAAGLDDFAVVWQSDDAQTHVDRIPIGDSLKSFERQSLILNGLEYRSIGGLNAVSEGYLFAFRHQNTQQMALIALDFKSWNLVSNSNSWRMLSDFASLDIQEAHTGKMIWQTAESLIGIQ